jgi:uncharacterized protein YndB with AHSA1/START domain
LESGRIIQSKIEIPAPLGEVWTAWTTESGAKTFFAPECSLDLRPLGAYEMYFDLEAEPGLQGGEGCRVLAVQPMAMLSFTWNAPPHLPEVRGQYTHVVVRFKTVSETATGVSLVHAGWGEGGQWDQAFDYFNSAWKKVVLPRLAYRFTVGPVDWSSPPDLAAFIEV